MLWEVSRDRFLRFLFKSRSILIFNQRIQKRTKVVLPYLGLLHPERLLLTTNGFTAEWLLTGKTVPSFASWGSRIVIGVSIT